MQSRFQGLELPAELRAVSPHQQTEGLGNRLKSLHCKAENSAQDALKRTSKDDSEDWSCYEETKGTFFPSFPLYFIRSTNLPVSATHTKVRFHFSLSIIQTYQKPGYTVSYWSWHCSQLSHLPLSLIICSILQSGHSFNTFIGEMVAYGGFKYLTLHHQNITVSAEIQTAHFLISLVVLESLSLLS